MNPKTSAALIKLFLITVKRIAMLQGSIFLAAFLLFSTACSSQRNLQQIEDRMYDVATLSGNGFSGILIYDPSEQQIIFEHNADRYFIPASNIKLLTFYTGLKMLGDSVPGLYYSVNNDSLVFWGSGDPSFLQRDFSYSPTLSFLKDREEKLFYTTPDFEESGLGSGWAWDDYNSAYSAERASFPVFGNVVTFNRKPFVPIPIAHPVFFQSQVFPDSSAVQFSGIKREPDRNTFTYSTHGRREQQIPFRYSHELAVELLEDTLQKEITILRDFPKRRRNINVLHSIPADSLYKKMLQDSDNFIAEQILLLSAGSISDSLSTSIAIDYMKENHLEDLPHELKWVDGSGLSRYNLVTPRSLVVLLEKIYQEIPEERLFSLMAVGGVSGTIKNLYRARTPYIFAKTGSLGNVHNLSGYMLSATGKVLIFSYMNNNYMIPTSQIKEHMEALLRNIHLTH